MIIVDTETTGLNPSTHSLISIGALDFSDPKNQFYEECQIWPDAQIDQAALEVNGFSLEELKNPNKKTVNQLIQSFLDWTLNIPDRTIGGQNTWFDRTFIIHAVRRANIDWHLGHRGIDLHSICYAHYLRHNVPPPQKSGRTSLSLDAISNYVGLPDEPKPHNALTGAKMEAECFSRLIYGKSLFTEYKKFALPDHIKKTKAS